MTGSLLQLSSTGIQDTELTGNPSITYFKTSYKTHTNFSIDTRIISRNNIPRFGGKTTFTVSRSDGDLLQGLYLKTVLPDLPAVDTFLRWTDHIGHFLVEYAEISIGGKSIDKHTSDWLEIWSQLTVPESKKEQYYEMIGQDPLDILNLNTGLQEDKYNKVIKGREIYIPIPFWFSKNPGLALPLLCLSETTVQIDIKFREKKDLVCSFELTDTELIENTTVYSSIGDLGTTELYGDFILLDTEERRMFSQTPHKYLIEKVDYVTRKVEGSVFTKTVEINLNSFEHPLKEIIWIAPFSNCTSDGHVQHCNYTDRSAINYEMGSYTTLTLSNLGAIKYDIDTLSSQKNSTNVENIQSFSSNQYVRPINAENPVISSMLTIDGRVKFNVEGDFSNLIEPYKKHTNVPKSPGINVYSFAMDPEGYNPSGTCNLSKARNVKLILQLKRGTFNKSNIENRAILSNLIKSDNSVSVFGVSYAVFKVMSGVGSLGYDL